MVDNCQSAEIKKDAEAYGVKMKKDQVNENVSLGLVTYRKIVKRLSFAGVDYQGLFVWKDYALVKEKLMFFLYESINGIIS